ncbi:stage II sporulation protein E [Leptospira ognonensis]|uniref:Stage II sporulation protein E n=1 Tax=Leptospira ognonensis TaxID=2484945 RepID=A0A4R9K1S5_9LEPT|nr:SpoIIE family protein phosphatase [Leptospira ognonensis]TGL58065.1 stage II sporulation protein E [Leptospira ognonensis]
MKSNRIIHFISRFVWIVIISFLFHGCHNILLPFQATDWRDGWEMRWITREQGNHFVPSPTETSESYSTYNIPYISLEPSQGRLLLVKRKISGLSDLENPSIFFRGGGQILGVFIDGDKILEQFRNEESISESGEIKFNLKFNSRYFPILPLDKSYDGRTIFILFHSYKNLPVGFLEPPLVANQTENFKALVNRNQSFAGLGFFFLVLGIFSSYLYLRRKKKAIVAFTFFLILSGLHFMSQAGFWGYLWYDSYEIGFYIFILTAFAIPIAALYFFDKLFGVGRINIIRMLWQFHLLFSLVILSLAFLQVITFMYAFVTFVWIALPALIIQVIIAWSEFISGKPRAWILVCGCLFLLFFNVHDTLSALGYIHSFSRISHWGFFLFVLALSLYSEEIFRNSEVKYAALQKEIATASRIQNAILPPSPPSWEELKIGVYYQPSEEVGGDFYDFQALGDHKYGIIIADVVGHGLGASIIASLSKFSFFQNNLHWRNPSFLMSSMNEDLVKRSYGRFTTASYFYFDMEKMKLIVSSAGHPSFFHWSKSRNLVIENKPKGKPLGILEGLTYMEEDIRFEKGDQFLLYTDGLPEEMGNRQTDFGTDALMESFRFIAGTNPQTGVEQILTSFRKQTGLIGLPHDDITLIYIEVV